MMKRILPGLLPLLLLAGCSFAPEYLRPDMDVPLAFGAGAEADSLEVEWWKHFQDPVLDALVERALAHNKNIDVAMARVDQARAYLGLTRAERDPGVQSNLQATAGLAGAGGDLLGGQSGGGYSLSSQSREMLNAAFSFQAIWEIDLWGRYRNSQAAARQQLLASETAQRGTMLGLAGQVCQAYFTLRNFDFQNEIALRTLDSRQQAVRIQESRHREGLISDLDLLRAQTEIDTLTAKVHTAQYQVNTAESALMLLLGASPREIYEDSPERGLSLEAIPAAPRLPAGLPADLLNRRPDIIAAEAQLRAANFQIGAARAQWFPSLSLTGSAGAQSLELDDLLGGGFSNLGGGLGLSLPFLNASRIKANVLVSEAKMREAAASYELAVQQAFREVRDALTGQSGMASIAESLAQAVSRLERAADMARQSYNSGLSSYMEVLDAERSLLDANLELANIRTRHLMAIVQVCLALGGGWA